jgi:hypothetical protein
MDSLQGRRERVVIYTALAEGTFEIDPSCLSPTNWNSQERFCVKGRVSPIEIEMDLALLKQLPELYERNKTKYGVWRNVLAYQDVVVGRGRRLDR